MITVAIIGILASVATPLYIKYTYRARTVEARTNLGAIRTAQVAFKTTNDTYLNVREEPPIASLPTGQKKSWPRLPGEPNVPSLSTTGTFANIGFEPSGSVYYHYACQFLAEAVRCEATSDLDANGSPALFGLAWRLDEANIEPEGPFSGAVPVPEWGPVLDMTPGRF